MTADEYLYDTDESNRPRELTYGILREPPSPFFNHQTIVLRLARLWTDHVESRQLGQVAVAPLDVVLDRERALIVQPDVLFVAHDRLSIIRDQVWGAPDLVAEVLSIGTEAHDRIDKVSWYRQYGVRECWIVDPLTRSVTIHDFSPAAPEMRRVKGVEPIQSSVLPELRTPVFRLFP